jgi:hypothetical protein
MNFSSFNEESASPPARGRKRDIAAIRQAMLGATTVNTVRTSSSLDALPALADETLGLSLRVLEDRRWSVSPSVAREKLCASALPYKGRRAQLIYSWASIFRAEGVDPEIARTATIQSHPHLFEDLLDTEAAAALLGFRDASSIRKLIIAGDLTETTFVRFGTRGVYRFRPAALTALRKRNLAGMIV